MQQSIWLALGLVFVMEGFFPFLFPQMWKRTMLQILQQSDRTLRIFGLMSMLIGLSVLYLIH